MPISIPIDQLGPELRKFREENDLSLRDVEAATGVSSSTLSRVERGHRPDVSAIDILADYLGVLVQAGGAMTAGIETDADLMRTIEVHLRAKKNLDSNVARAIARSYELIMKLEIERAKENKED